MSPLERLTLSSLRGQSVEKDEVASVGQFIGRLLAREKEIKQNLGKNKVSNNSLPTVFAHFEKRVELLFDLNTALWTERKPNSGFSHTKSRSFRKQLSTPSKQALKRQDSSSVSVQGRTSKEWNRVVASMKRSPSSVKRESQVESTSSVPKSAEFYNQIGMFLKSSANDKDLRDRIKRRSAIAHARLVGMEALKNALDLEHVGCSGHILLNSIGRNAQFAWGGAVPKATQQGVLFNGRKSSRQIRVPHIRNGIRGANEAQIEAKVSQKYFDLLNVAIQYASKEEISIQHAL